MSHVRAGGAAAGADAAAVRPAPVRGRRDLPGRLVAGRGDPAPLLAGPVLRTGQTRISPQPLGAGVPPSTVSGRLSTRTTAAPEKRYDTRVPV